MTQMATMGKVKTHEAPMRGHQSLVHLQVGRGTTEALNIDTPLLGVEVEGLQGAGLACKLNGVDVLVATIVTRAGVALGVLVGHGRAESIEDSARSDVLRGNQKNGLALALDFLLL